MEGPQAQPHGRESYKKRFPKHHRRRKRLEKQTESGAPAASSAVAGPTATTAAGAAGEPELNRAGFGIINWTDAVLQELDEGGGWAHRKRRVAGRGHRRHTHDELESDHKKSGEHTGDRGGNRGGSERAKDTAAAYRLPERCVTESPRNEMPSAPPKLSKDSPDSFLTRLRRAEQVTAAPAARPFAIAQVPARLVS